jgi:2-dehydro-3-deoxyglucarate aldolase/4-hydroxy-2-oxoheptanedioate aldolase
MPDLIATGFRNRLGHEPVGVLWLAMGNVTIVENAVKAGAEAIVLDLQHGLWSREGVEHAVAAARSVPLLVRVGENSALAISSALDAGAEGVLIPLVETARQAAKAVAFSRFPPAGIRSGGGIRPLQAGFMDYVAASEKRTSVGVMIETRKGLRNLKQIVATPGLDYVFIGTGDLSLSLGMDRVKAGKLDQACAKILAACRKAGIGCGIFTMDAAAAVRRRAEGYDMVVIGSDVPLLEDSFRTAVERYRGGPQTSRRFPCPRLPCRPPKRSPRSLPVCSPAPSRWWT